MIFLGLFLMVSVSLTLLYLMLKSLREAKRLKQERRTTQGTLLELKLVSSWVYLASFRYTVNEKEYTSTQAISARVFFSWRKAPPETFQVTYLASKPRQGYLFPSGPRTAVAAFALSMGMVLFLAVLLLLLLFAFHGDPTISSGR